MLRMCYGGNWGARGWVAFSCVIRRFQHNGVHGLTGGPQTKRLGCGTGVWYSFLISYNGRVVGTDMGRIGANPTVAARHGIRQISTRHIHRKSSRRLEGMELGSHCGWHNGCVHGISGWRGPGLWTVAVIAVSFHRLCTILDSDMKTFHAALLCQVCFCETDYA